jgi:hypothetical protein
MTDATNPFTRMMPGFDFLQGLVKNAGAAMPGVGQWIAPTLNPEELEKRIEELRTVQFWLEQNARMLAATIQALEVQRMTLSTLKTMNVSLGDLTESLKIRTPEPAPEPQAPAPAAGEPATTEAPVAPAGAIDPMQWWSALTQQFTQLATSALNESTGDAARNLAGAMVKQGLDAAGETFRQAAAMPASMAQGLAGQPATAPARAPRAAAKSAAKTGTRTARKTAGAQRSAAARPKPGAGKPR